jgi:broad-specificity NMP kinase
MSFDTLGTGKTTLCKELNGIDLDLIDDTNALITLDQTKVI